MDAIARARRFRRAVPATERKLWAILRGRRLSGLKFRRQVPIGPYVADFACLRHRLIVEADGPFHDPERDAARDTWLRHQGFRVLRFANRDVDVPGLAISRILQLVETPAFFEPGATPHPACSAGHLLPQGEKESSFNASG